MAWLSKSIQRHPQKRNEHLEHRMANRPAASHTETRVSFHHHNHHHYLRSLWRKCSRNPCVYVGQHGLHHSDIIYTHTLPHLNNRILFPYSTGQHCVREICCRCRCCCWWCWWWWYSWQAGEASRQSVRTERKGPPAHVVHGTCTPVPNVTYRDDDGM